MDERFPCKEEDAGSSPASGYHLEKKTTAFAMIFMSTLIGCITKHQTGLDKIAVNPGSAPGSRRLNVF